MDVVYIDPNKQDIQYAPCEWCTEVKVPREEIDKMTYEEVKEFIKEKIKELF